MMQTNAPDPAHPDQFPNQQPFEDLAATFLTSEARIRKLYEDMSKTIAQHTKFQNDVTLPEGYYGYVRYPWQRALPTDADDSPDDVGRWLAKRDAPQKTSHPYNFSKSQGMLAQVLGLIGQASALLHDAHYQTMQEMCEFRIINEGPGK